MPALSKKTEANLKRLRAMHAQGGSDREIGEALGIGGTTIKRWREDLGLGVVAVAGPRSTRARTVTPESVRQDAQAAAGELSATCDVIPAGEDAAGHVARRLASMRGLIDRLTPAAEREEYAATSLKALIETETRLASALAELTPPTPPDPERDPANVEAADTARRKLERLIGVAEAGARCCHCGRPPFAPAAGSVGP